jgi:integrase
MSTKTASLTEAKRILADHLAAVRAEGWVFDNCKKAFLFQELADDYYEWHRGHYSSSAQQAKPRVDHLVTHFGKLVASKIKSEDITGYRTWRAKQKVGGKKSAKSVSHSTINRELDTFNAMFNWAKGEDKYKGVIKLNPFVRRKHRTKESASPMGWFEPESKRRFLEACDQLPTTKKHFPPRLLKDLVQVLWGTGMRIDECVTLRKRQIKLDYSLVQLEGWQTKNKKAGDVELRTDDVFHIFRTACEGKGDKELVFQWKDGDVLRQPGRCKVTREPGGIPYSAVASAFKGACARAGLLKLTLHSCRKTAATQMAIDGYSVLEIKDALHHKDITTTLRYINQTAVNQARRKQRAEGLKNVGVFCDNDGPSKGTGDRLKNEFATQMRHAAHLPKAG